MAVDETSRTYRHPLYGLLEKIPGTSVGLTTADIVLNWGLQHSLWAFPMATACCGIEFMATMTSRFDMDQFGTFTRPTPRQCDVMVVAGTVTVKMAPRIKKLWDFMPEPKWCVAMGSCAISGDFFRDSYAVVPGVDTFIPVDVYIPGCPPAPDHVHHGMRQLAERIRRSRLPGFKPEEDPVARAGVIRPSIPAIGDPARDPAIDRAQMFGALSMDPGCDVDPITEEVQRQPQQERS